MLFRTLLILAIAALAHPASAAEPTAPGVTVTKAWARATPAGATVGAAYIEIKAGAVDHLTGASSPAAGRVELHTHIDDNGVMRMRRLDAIELKAGETRAFTPGGDHIMLFDLKEPLKEGGTLPLTLTFEKAGRIEVEAKIEPIGSMGPPGAHKH